MTKPSAITSVLALAGIAAAAAAGGGDTLMMNKIGGYIAGDEGEDKFEFEVTATKLSSKVRGLSYPILSYPILSYPTLCITSTLSQF